MNFTEALEIVKKVVGNSIHNEYDGIVVKRLEPSNTLDEGRTTNQTHIAISGEQMDMFPYIMAEGYFNCDYDDKDTDLKKYFITQIPLYIYRDNVKYLSDGNEAGIVFDGENRRVLASVVRSRRKGQADQVQLSLTRVDEPEFVVFRKLLHEDDYIVLMKHKEKLVYDCFGVKAVDEVRMEPRLLLLNNHFFKLLTSTKVDIEKIIQINHSAMGNNREITIQELGNILWEMYSNAEDKMQVAMILTFGVKYGEEIIQKNFKVPEIIKAAGLNDSYSAELYKGINIYRCLDKNLYGISISDGKQQSKESTSGDNRKTGAENIILYGVPGAGKSYAIKTRYCSDERYMERVVFHPDYMYSDFVGQILPRVEQVAGNDKLKYVFTPGPFTRMLQKAEDDPEHYYYLVIEEINRGNAPAIFGEIFQLLDRKGEEEFPADEVGESEYGISNYDIAREVYKDENHLVRIPSNMFVLATMNTADQNIFTLDTAFQRRWNMELIENRFDKTEHSDDLIEGTDVSWGTFATVINDIVTQINIDVASSEDKRLGTYFAKKRELDADRFPEKVLKYLWDDAFKFDKTAVFHENYKSLDEVIAAYEKAQGDKLSAVLNPGVYEKMCARMQQSNFNIEN